MIKGLFRVLLFFIVCILPFRVNATCSLFYDTITSYAGEYTNEDTVASGEVLEYVVNTSFSDAMGQISNYNKTVKINLGNENGVNCTVSPTGSNIYNYNNNVFTVIEDNIPIKSTQTDGSSISFSSFDEEIAKIRCQMPTIEKYKKGYNFKISVVYEKVSKNSNGDKIETITSTLNNDIHLVNPTYLKSLKKPALGLTATLEGVTLDPSCNGMFCNGETTNGKITLKYSLQDTKASLGYGIDDGKFYELKDKTGSVTIDLNYGENYVGIQADGDGSSEYEKVSKELDEYHSFSCLDDIDFSDVREGRGFFINRIDNRSNDSTLKSLKISNAKINFNPNLKNYMASVPNDVHEVSISSQLNHSKASYVSGFGNRKISLNEGSNTVLVKVRAENGAESVYTITITREKSNNNNLISISVDDKVIKTSKDKYKYSLKVNNGVTKVNITGVAEHSKAQFTVDNNRDLVEGSNIITLTVTAPNGEKRIYELDVFRDSLISTNSDLKSITIEGYKLDFSSNVKKYSLKIKDEEELKIKVVTDSDKAKSLITGNSKLQNDSVIKIKVTAEDEKTESIYEIRIIKEKKNSFTYIIIGGVVLFIIGFIIFISLGKKKGNSNNNHNTANKYEVKKEVKPIVEVTSEVKTEVKNNNTEIEKKEEVKNSDPKLTNQTNNGLPTMSEVKSDDELI